MRFWFALITGLVVTSGLHAQTASPGMAPTLKIVRSVDMKQGHITFNEIVTRTVEVKIPKEMVVNGQKITVFVTEYRTEQAFNSIQAANSRVITPDGKQLPIDEVWRRVTANTVVAVSGDGTTPATAFLKALSPQTLIIISPPSVPNIAPPPMPMLIPPPKR